MQIQHDYYEGLCAAAVAGQIAPDEVASLQEHARTCEECRRTVIAFRHIASEILPEYAMHRFPLKPPVDLTSRFIARARSEGIPLRHLNSTRTRTIWFPSFGLVAEFVGAILLFVLGSNFLMTYWRAKHRPNKTDLVPVAPTTTEPTRNLQAQLQALQARLNDAEERRASKERALESEHTELSRLAGRLWSLENSDLELRRELSERDVQIAEVSANREQLKGDFAKLQSTKATEDLMLQADKSEVNELRAQVASLSDQINEREQLSAAAEQAKDLIVARNLHIVDVHDNANGTRPRPFGRIFYEERKKLIFYAYDLGERSNAKVTFCVWGEKSGTTEQARHLGILRADDKRDGRWVVTFDDPQVLAEINTVFVTAESPRKQPIKPSGARILVAFLDGAPNHP